MAVNHCSHSDTISDGDEGKVLASNSSSLTLFGKSCEIHIILHDHRGCVPGLEQVTERDIDEIRDVLDELKSA